VIACCRFSRKLIACCKMSAAEPAQAIRCVFQIVWKGFRTCTGKQPPHSLCTSGSSVFIWRLNTNVSLNKVLFRFQKAIIPRFSWTTYVSATCRMRFGVCSSFRLARLLQPFFRAPFVSVTLSTLTFLWKAPRGCAHLLGFKISFRLSVTSRYWNDFNIITFYRISLCSFSNPIWMSKLNEL
jgi:hypothetical protein